MSARLEKIIFSIGIRGGLFTSANPKNSMVKPMMIVDQEVGGSIPPSRTIFFNSLEKIHPLSFVYGVQMASITE
ncbi:MAG: hypothetical protein ACR2OR_10085 [Hyphomicrobiales bacterium]